MIIPHNDFQAETFLTEVLGAHNVKQHGDELIHSCLLPFGMHARGDREPSASLNSEKLVLNCYVCGGGDLVWATQTILQITSGEARRLIEKNFSPTNITKEQFITEIENYWKRSEDRYSMPEYKIEVLKPFAKYTKYMDERGVSREVQKEMMTGINLDNADEIGGQWITQPRIVIPHIFGGKLRGMVMRKIDSRQLGHKYKNTPRFPKDRTLYNWDSIEGRGELIVVESAMSVLLMKTHGFHNVVATFGAQANEEQLKLMTRFSDIILFPDGDRVGYAAQRSVDIKGNETGTVPFLMKKTRTWIVDHGFDGTKYNEKDPGNYNAEELKKLLDSRIKVEIWNWRDEDAYKKIRNSKVRKEKARS